MWRDASSSSLDYGGGQTGLVAGGEYGWGTTSAGMTLGVLGEDVVALRMPSTVTLRLPDAATLLDTPHYIVVLICRLLVP